MKKSFIIIYSVIVSIVLIFSISYFAVNIYNENAHGSLRTELRFDKLVNGIKATYEKNNISNSERFRQIQNTIGDTKDFSYLLITVDGSPSYVFPENLDYTSSLQNTSSLVIPYNRTLKINGSLIIISAGLYSLRPSSIFDYSKISFFIILIVTLITIILIIYNNHLVDAQPQRISVKAKKIKEKESFSELADNEQEIISTEENEIENESEEACDETPVEDIAVEETWAEESPLEEGAIEDDSPSSSPETVEVEQVVEEAKNEELPLKDFEPVELVPNAEPLQENGLFSPDTGFGWESYLMTRLDNELNRATASELDLALFIIKLDGLGRKNPLMKKICEYLTVEFQFKDLLFEYKDDSICGIKISMNIDSAITFAEKLVSEIKSITAQENPTILAGLTTRGIRIVSGERLLKEADEALKHAAEDVKCPVVGFRADAVKYRKFLETN